MSAAPASANASAPGGPCAGMRVVDWTHVLAGPFAGYNLALLGADVVRIERPRAFDMVRERALDAALAPSGLGEAFVVQGAGKRSLSIDARDARAADALHALVARADVLIENFRPGKLASLGFDPAELVRRHPRLVVCSITGYGQQGARAMRRAYDHAVQASSGLMAANADEQGRPQRLGFPAIDYAVGLHAAMAITTALLRRERELARGERLHGEWLDVSMQDSALALLAPTYASWAVSGRERERSRSTAFSGSPLSGTFETAAGWLALVCNSDAQARALPGALREAGVPEALAARITGAAAQGDVDDTQARLAEALRCADARRWEDILVRHGIPASAVRAPREAYDEARTERPERWPAVTLEHADGRRVQVPGPGFGSSRPLVSGPAAPVPRGWHSREVLREAGLDDARIDAMIADGVVEAPPRA